MKQETMQKRKHTGKIPAQGLRSQLTTHQNSPCCLFFGSQRFIICWQHIGRRIAVKKDELRSIEKK